MNTITPFLTLVEKLNTPLGWFLAFLVTGLPIALGILRSSLSFHNEFIRHARTKNIDRALSASSAGSSEQEVLLECRAQESIFINVGLRLSRMERDIVLKWMATAPITLDLVRKSWPQVTWDDGILFPRLAWYDVTFMIYGICAFLFMLILGSLALIAVLNHVLLDGLVQLLLIPIALYLMAALINLQIQPMVSTRRLTYRLEKFGWSAQGKQPSSPALGDRDSTPQSKEPTYD